MSEQPSHDAQEQITTLLAEIKDPSGRQKYADVETALKALKASQDYIPGLESQLNDLKQTVQTQQSIDSIKDLLNSQTTESEEQQTTDEETNQSDDSQPSLEEQFKAFLSREKQQEQASKNMHSVKEKLAEIYGEKQQEMYENKAKELGISIEFLNSMAQHSPQAVLEYFKEAPNVNLTADSSINTTNLKPNKEQVKNVMVGASRQEIQAAWDACRPE